MTILEFLTLGNFAISLGLGYGLLRLKFDNETLWTELGRAIEDAEQEEEETQRFFPVDLTANTVLLDSKDGSITLIDTGKQREIGFRENRN